jgi:hypothetical protein
MDDTKTQGYTFTFGEQAASRDSPKHRGNVEELTLNKSVTPVSSPKQARMRMRIASSLFSVRYAGLRTADLAIKAAAKNLLNAVLSMPR